MRKTLIDIVAANVQRARTKLDWSLRDLATRAKLSPNTVRNIETPAVRAPNARGEASPRLDVLDKLAEAMGFATWQLLLENFDPNDPPPERVPTAREIAAYRKIENAFKELQADEPKEPSD